MPSFHPVDLGAFQLVAPLAEGSQARVFRAVHRDSGLLVAVKVAFPVRSRLPSFEREVRALAGLHHPNVVTVYDHGVVPEGLEMPEGAPWLAMELARSKAPGSWETWDEVLHATRQVLAGLAHAHAHGIVHRDIKPGNLLLGEHDGGDRVRVVVSDFGIARALDDPEAPFAGTPHYMAPESIEGRDRDVGPWTDLYAVGVLLWKWTTGLLPFAGVRGAGLLQLHLTAEPPAYRPRMAVPEGTEELLRSLLGKTPASRPAFAADVLRALDGLGAPVGRTLSDLPPDIVGEDTTVTLPAMRRANPRAYAARSDSAGPRGSVLAPAEYLRRLHGAGLALFAHRRPALVGRDAERDRLWGELAAVRAEGRARLVVLRADEGLGRTHLAAWLVAAAREVGLADGSVVACAGSAQASALRRFLDDQLGTYDLDDIEIRERLAARVPSNIVQRMLPALVGDVSAAELRQHTLRWLQHATRARPFVLVLDDADEDIDALRLAEQALLLRDLQPCPLLVVVTARTAATSDEVDRLLLKLGELGAERVPLEPLDAEGTRALVRDLLGLGGGLAARVEELCAGNPSFARAVVAAWIDAGLLEITPSGFDLAGGVKAELPSTLKSLWAERMAFLADRSPDVRLALAAAARLGAIVDMAVWFEVLERSGLPVPAAVLAELERRGLASLAHGSLRFANPAVIELVRTCVDEAACRRIHGAIAAVMETHGSSGRELARHLVVAGKGDEAVPLLLAELDERQRQRRPDPDLLAQLERTLRETQRSESDAAWGLLEVHRANLHWLRGELAESERVLERAHLLAWRYDHDDVARLALDTTTLVLLREGRTGEAFALAVRQAKDWRSLDRLERSARMSHVASRALRQLGQWDDALRLLEEALEAIGAESRAAHPILQGMLTLLLQQRKFTRAERVAESLSDLVERWDLRVVETELLQIRGEIHRAQGRLREAEACYREASHRMQDLEVMSFLVVELNRAIVQLELGNFESARGRLRRPRAFLARQASPSLTILTDSVDAAVLAALNDPGIGDVLDRAEALLDKHPVEEPEIAALFERAAWDLARNGRNRLAVRARDVAELARV